VMPDLFSFTFYYGDQTASIGENSAHCTDAFLFWWVLCVQEDSMFRFKELWITLIGDTYLIKTRQFFFYFTFFSLTWQENTLP